jgi:hypothetical protein
MAAIRQATVPGEFQALRYLQVIDRRTNLDHHLGSEAGRLVMQTRATAAASRTSPDSPIQLSGWAGVFGIVLTTIGSSLDQIWRFPATDQPPEQITSFITHHHALLQVGQLLNTIGLLLWLVAGAGIWTRLRQGPESNPLILSCFALGFIGLIVMIWVGFTPFWVLLYRGQSEIAHARVLYDLTFATLAISGMATAMVTGAYAALVIRGRQFPRHTVALAVLCTVTHVLLLVSFLVPHGFFSLQGQLITVIPATLFAWILDTSIALVRTKTR